MNWIACFLTALGLILNAKKKIICWPIWIIGDFLWIIHFLLTKEYAGTVVNIIFIAINICGWYSWNKFKITNNNA